MSFGPPVGSPFSGPSASQSSARAGLPFAGMPSELAARAEEILAEEPEHRRPEITFSPADYDRRPFTLRRFLSPHRGALAVAVVLVVIETVAFQAGPLLIQIGLDRAIVPRQAEVLAIVAIAYVAAIAVNALAARARILFTGRLGERLMYELRIRVFSHLQRQSLDFYTDQKSGVILTRMTSDIDALAALFQDGLVNLAVQLLTLVVITIILVALNPVLAAITLLAVVPAMAALTWWFRGASERTYRHVREKIANVLADLSENLAGMRIIVANNRRRHNAIHHANVVGEHRDANVSASTVGAIYGPANEAVGVIGQAVLLLIGGRMVLDGSLTVGELFAFLLYLTAFFAPIQQLVQLYNAYQSGQAAVAKLRDLLALDPAVAEAPDASELPPIDGRIELASVGFGYDPAVPVLRDLSLVVEPGETIAVVGPTGAGKSTVAKLVTRFYDPDNGAVSIDGIDLRTVTLHSLRSQLGVVPQEPFLFNRSIRDNVAFARPDAGDEEVLAACRAVGLDDLIDRHDDGLDALVHERGSSLSSGERQLLALARAFLARPRVLVLDEATSNLDLVSESKIEAALDVVLEGRTAIIIAHRLATAMRADRIAVIEDGRLTEIGNHAELVALGGHYASMHAAWVAHT
ncbi:MAG: ABC transporter ATP-binding protein/permease [Acidimicrobiia bacterium]|nr:ABC transporter ATP-binding protein/permease [Acidimicrobiia bacterium]